MEGLDGLVDKVRDAKRINEGRSVVRLRGLCIAALSTIILVGASEEEGRERGSYIMISQTR